MWRGLTNAQWARAPRVSVKLSKLCRQTHSCLALRKDPSTIPLCPGVGVLNSWRSRWSDTPPRSAGSERSPDVRGTTGVSLPAAASRTGPARPPRIRARLPWPSHAAIVIRPNRSS